MKTFIVALIAISFAGNEAFVAQGADRKRPGAKRKAEAVTARVLTWKQTKTLIKSFKGEVVVLDVWSTSCLPCMREFPSFVALQNEHKKGLRCISLNVDYFGDEHKPSDELKEGVLDFLKRTKATTLNIISSDADETIYEQAHFSSIPAVFVFNRKGRLAKRFTDDPDQYGPKGFNYENHITPLVEKLLGSK